MKRVAGLDVHKDSIFASVKKGRYQSQVKEFDTTTEGLSELYHWLHGEHVAKVAMESTGVYWMPVWWALEQDFKLYLVNPYFIKQMPGRKTDVQDAQWIATLLDKGLLRSSVVPEKQIRTLRAYLRRYAQLQGQMNRCFQSMERQLSQCNIKIASLTSAIGSKTVLKVVESITKGVTSAQQFMGHVHGRIINSKGKRAVHRSLEGIIEEHDIFLLGQIYQDYLHIEAQIQQLLIQAEYLADTHYKAHIERLQTIPGVSKLSAVIIFAEIGGDITRFKTAHHLSGWCGLSPKNEESAGKIKNTSIGKGNKYLRRILVQTAWAASRKKGCYLKEKFERLCVKKSRKKALIAIARKQLVIAWYALSNQENYKEPLVVLTEKQLQQKRNYYQHKLKKLEKVG
jgi:transposase